MDTSAGLASGRTQNCRGGDSQCLAECIGETEVVSVSAQLLPDCGDLAITYALNIRHGHREPCILGFQIDWECQL